MTVGATTHNVTVEGVGLFTFTKRNVYTQVRIEAEAVKILGGPTEDPGLHTIALALATLQELTVAAPAGWELKALDPLEPEDMDRMWAVHEGLRAAEKRFRREAQARRAAARAGNVEDDGLRVPPEIPAAAD